MNTVDIMFSKISDKDKLHMIPMIMLSGKKMNEGNKC